MEGKERLENLKASYMVNGLAPRIHGNVKRLPHNALGYDVIKNAVRFINSYAQLHAILLPGRIPGYKRDDLQLLPTNTTKMVVIITLQNNNIPYSLYLECLDKVQVVL